MAKTMDDAPLRPAKATKSICLSLLLNGSITRKTAIGLATTIINNPVRSAGPITAGILDGNDKSPNRKNISTCISPVVPSKKLTRFLLL